MHTVESPESENDDLEVEEAGKYLRTTVCQNFAKLLDELAIKPIDSSSLTQVF